MREDLELKTQEAFEGATGDDLARELEADPAALAEYVDQLQIHNRLGVAFGEEPASFTDSVLREIRYKGDSGRFAQGVVGRLKEQGGLRRRWLELVAAAFVLSILGVLLWRGDGSAPAADGPDLLFVVGRLPLAPGDARVKERLDRTYRVQVRSAWDVRPDDARGRALVLISSTAAETLLKTMFRDVATPVLTWEPRLFHDLGMIPGSVHQKDWGAASHQTTLRTPSGPVAATSTPSQYSWGRVRPDATVLATLDGDAEKAVVFRYERGASMPGTVAPARRAGFFLFDATPLALTDAGWALFDDSVRWCAGR